MAAATRPSQAPGQAQSDVTVGRVGKLVALEGIDGSGKSSLAQGLQQRLVEHGLDARLTREPTESWIGLAVKKAIRESNDPFVEAFLFLADHADHVRQVAQWLGQGQVVVSDRWGGSFLAYQAASLEPLLRPKGTRALDWLQRVQQPVHRAPDVTLLLDLSPDVAVHRLQGRKELIKFEDARFLEVVRRNYLELARHDASYEVLDAAHPPAKVLDMAWAALVRRKVAHT